MDRAAPMLIGIFLATTLAAIGYDAITSPASFPGNPSLDHGLSFTVSIHQGIAGKIIIANTSPVCRLGGNESATGPSLVIISAEGSVLVVQPSWTLVDRCALVTQFVAPLPAGTYSLTVSPCSYLGCRVVPTEVSVNPGAFSPVNIEIVTGIV